MLDLHADANHFCVFDDVGGSGASAVVWDLEAQYEFPAVQTGDVEDRTRGKVRSPN